MYLGQVLVIEFGFERFVQVCGERELATYGVPDLVKYRSWLETRFGGYSMQFATIVIKNLLQYCKTTELFMPILIKYMPMRLELHRNNASALFIRWHRNRGWSSRLTSRSVERFVKTYVEKSGIKEKITPHSFRHGWVRLNSQTSVFDAVTKIAIMRPDPKGQVIAI